MIKRLLLLLLALCLPCYGEGASLMEALLRMRTSYPAAEITGRFADARGLSIYRSHAGLHNGYDIGMPAGAAVPAVWAGTVVAITPWTSTQVGVSVQTGPFEVTYGHLIPGSVKVGDFVKPGDILGTVAIDHVDIKMRDGDGAFVDFGEGASASTPLDPADLAEERARQALEDLQNLKTRLASLNFELGSLQREAKLLKQERSKLTRMVPQLDQLVADGAMPACDEGRLPLRLHFVDTRLKEVQTRTPQVSKQRETLQAQLWLAEGQARQAQAEAARLGRKVEAESTAQAPAKLPATLPSGGDRLEQLLKYGVLSKKEYDEARRRQRWDAAANKQPVGGAPGGGGN